MQPRYARIEDLPATLPIFPLNGVLLLPRGRLPLNIFEPRYLAMFDDALAGDRMVGMVQLSTPQGSGQLAVFQIGCAGRITSFQETDDGRYHVALDGVARFRVQEELPVHHGYRRIGRPTPPI
jgi:Lon protease-like protein